MQGYIDRMSDIFNKFNHFKTAERHDPGEQKLLGIYQADLLNNIQILVHIKNF
jgi:hypothetical protein